MDRRLLYLCIATIPSLVFMAGCLTHAGSDLRDTRVYRSTEDIPDPVCEEDEEPARFKMIEAGVSREFGDFQLPDPSPDVHFESPGIANNVGLDLCIGVDNDGNEIVRLQQIVLVGAAFHGLAVAEVVDSSVIRGLEPAIFDRNYTNLRIEVPLEEMIYSEDFRFEVPQLLVIDGSGTGDEAVAVATLLTREDGELRFGRFDHVVLLGRFEFGLPYLDLICDLGLTLSEASFVAESAQFLVQYCAGGGTSGTTFYTVVGAKVRDRSEHLPKSIRGQEVVIDWDQVADRIRFTQHHHNSCDALVISTDHARYGFRSFTGFGEDLEPCSEVIDGAPTRQPDDPNFTLYRIAYHGQGAPQVGVLAGCRHHLLACRQ